MNIETVSNAERHAAPPPDLPVRSRLCLLPALVLLPLLTLLLFIGSPGALAQGTQSVTLAWDPNTTDPGIAGYNLYYGTTSGSYSVTNNVGSATNSIVSGLQSGVTYYFAVTCYNTSGLESPPSNEAVYQVPTSGGGPVNPIITWASPASIVYGTALSAAQLNAAANVAGTFAYSPAAGAVLPASAGVTLTAIFTPSDTTSYNACTNTVSLTVLPAALTVSANNKSKVYGASLPLLTASYSGFVNGDTPASLATPASLSTTAAASSPVGTYPVVVSGATSPNYSISFVNGTLTVTPTPLTITANNQTKVYGAALPVFTASYAGFVNGDTSASLTTPVSLTTTATASSPAGTYPVAVSGATSPNYSISFVNGTLTVTPAPLTITANNQTKVYGATLPVLTASYAGFVNGDTSASLTTPVSLATTATASSPTATYPVVVSGATSPNYLISFVSGNLTVTPAALTITANNQTKVYGAALPVLTASYAGFVNGDTGVSLTTPVSLTTTASASSHVGAYPITVSGATSANYAITFVNGSLSITPTLLTITADNKSMVKGAGVPALTASYTGFVNGDSPSSLSTPVQLATTATSASPVGTYPITATGAADADYAITQVNGTLTVTSANLVSLAVNSATNSVTLGQTLQFTALGTYSDGTTQNLTTSVTWSSTTPSVATVNSAGLATGLATGSSIISAAQSGITGTASLSVVASTITSTASFTNTGAITIPAYGAASPYPSTNYVSGLSGTVSKITVTLNGFTHANVRDVNVLLVSPGGNKTIVMAHAGGNYSVSGLTLTFDDAATAMLPSAGRFLSGTYLPTCYGTSPVFPSPAPGGSYVTNLATFQGADPNGAWSLYVADDKNKNSGKIANGWKLTVTTVSAAPASLAQPSQLAGNASLMALAPGATSLRTSATGLSIRSLTVSPTGRVELRVAGHAGQAYRLFSSTDLLSWQEVYHTVAPADEFILVDETQRSSDRAFYRLEPNSDSFQK